MIAGNTICLWYDGTASWQITPRALTAAIDIAAIEKARRGQAGESSQ
jgi:hypothetical protein